MVRVANLHDMVEAGTQAKRRRRDVRRRRSSRRSASGPSTQRERAGALRRARAAPGARRARDPDHHLPSRRRPRSARSSTQLFERQVFPVLTPLVIGAAARSRTSPTSRSRSPSCSAIRRRTTRSSPGSRCRRSCCAGSSPIGDAATRWSRSTTLIAAQPRVALPRHGGDRPRRSSASPATPTTTSPTRPTTCCRRSRRRSAAAASARWSGSRSTPSIERAPARPAVAALDIAADEVYEVDGLLGLADLWDVAGALRPRRPALPAVQPASPRRGCCSARRARRATCSRRSASGDILVHHPYDSFTTSVERFVKQAVYDPDVLAIKQTVYRTSADSPLVPALIEAAERGKQAVCMVELKARFDEQRQHPLGEEARAGRRPRRLRDPGPEDARQVHPRRPPRGRRRPPLRPHRHRQLQPEDGAASTPTSACSPADPEIGADIAEMFNYLTGYARPRSYRKVLVAPFNLAEGHPRRRSSGRSSPTRAATPARIRMKMNSLLDPPSIRALYRASQAGVEVEINVRGICALRPGVAGVSENIEVVSVRRALPRALADLLVRAPRRAAEHLHRLRRPDAAQPLQPRRARDPDRGRRRQRPSWSTSSTARLADNASAWTLDNDGEWTAPGPGGEPEPSSATCRAPRSSAAAARCRGEAPVRAARHATHGDATPRRARLLDRGSGPRGR